MFYEYNKDQVITIKIGILSPLNEKHLCLIYIYLPIYPSIPVCLSKMINLQSTFLLVYICIVLLLAKLAFRVIREKKRNIMSYLPVYMSSRL